MSRFTKTNVPIPENRRLARLTYELTRITDSITDNQRIVRVFSMKLVGAPWYELEWSQAVFTAAAELKVAEKVVRYLEGGRSAIEIRDELTRELLLGAGSPARSTSPQHNLMDQEIVGATARFLERHWFGVPA